MNSPNPINPINEAFGAIPGGRVLDIGTGPGGMLRHLQKHLGSSTLFVGIDAVRPGGLDHNTVHFIQMDAHCLGFSPASFDTASIGHSLHHMSAPAQVLGEMLRALRPGGYCIIREMYCDGQTDPQLTHVALHHLVAEIDTQRGITHNPTFTRQELVEMVQAQGLHDLALYDSDTGDTDPKDPDTLAQIRERIQKAAQYAKDLQDYHVFQERLHDIAQRLDTFGFQRAAELVAIGRKPG